MEAPHLLKQIILDLTNLGGRVFYTGGYVRDHLLGIKSHDIDVEIFGLRREHVIKTLSSYGECQLVGASFPILKLKGYPYWDFIVVDQEGFTPYDSCQRRDFTINALLMDALSGEIIDYVNGRQDLAKGLIRPTCSQVFEQDPLRAYRAMQLAARMNLHIEESTLDIIGQVNLQGIAKERIFIEFSKLLQAPLPSTGLRYMQESGILSQNHPLLQCLVGCGQSPEHHPEGDVWEHTLLVVNRAAELKVQSGQPEVFMFAALLHDIGKPLVTRAEASKVTAYGHDVEGARLARVFLEDMTSNRKFIGAVSRLVREHMQPVLLFKQRHQVSDRAIRKLVARVKVRELLLLAQADFQGRGHERHFEPVRDWLLGRIDNLGLDPDQEINPVVRGKDLVAMGLKPGPAFKRILDGAYEAQLEGKTRSEILRQIKRET
ncbi:CCA tRNA nucleotidyltransferase [Syntrophomonas erecta]